MKTPCAQSFEDAPVTSEFVTLRPQNEYILVREICLSRKPAISKPRLRGSVGNS